MRLLFLGRSLETGGAERQMVSVALGLKARGHKVSVALFYNVGPLCQELKKGGVPIIDLRKGGRWDIFGFAFRLASAIREAAPDVLYSFLTTPNIVVALIKPFVAPFRLVWGIRASNMDMKQYDTMSRFANRLETYFSYRADAIVANSYAGAKHLKEKGYGAEKIAVVPNGIDCDRFTVTAHSVTPSRPKLDVPEGPTLIIVPARLDPMKGHDVLFDAIAALKATPDTIRFLLAGGGAREYGEKLKRLSEEKGVTDYLIWLGERNDMPDLYRVSDACLLPSLFGEGFSNALAEAMASGLYCIATDVGDASQILADTGTMVPPGDVIALAAALDGVAERIVLNKGRERREHIIDNFGIDRMVTATEAVLAGQSC